MQMEAGTTKSETVIGSAGGVVVIKITVYDKYGNALEPQPNGQFQIWQIVGQIKLIKPCNSAQEVEDWLAQEENAMFRQVSEDELELRLEQLERELASNQIDNQAGTFDCDVRLVKVENGVEVPLNRQLQQPNRDCVIGPHPVIVGGWEHSDDPPTHPEQPRTRRPGR